LFSCLIDLFGKTPQPKFILAMGLSPPTPCRFWAALTLLPPIRLAHSWPMEIILLSICLEHGKVIEEILGKIKAEKG